MDWFSLYPAHLRSAIGFKCVIYIYIYIYTLDLCTGLKSSVVFTVLLRLFSARIRREGEERSSPEWGRKWRSDLDFTNVCWRKNIRVFTVLFYFKIRYESRWPVEIPESRRVWNDRSFSFYFSEETRYAYERERRVQFSDGLNLIHRDPCSILWLRSQLYYLTHREPGSMTG